MSDRLEGNNIVIFDIETLASADDCRFCGGSSARHVLDWRSGYHAHTPIGWNDHARLGLAIGCWWDCQDGTYHWFDAHTLAATLEHWVARQCLLVTYNGLQFDGPLLAEVVRGPLKEEPARVEALVEAFARLMMQGYDVLGAIWQADPDRKFARGLNGLDAVSQANGYGRKAMDGATAPRLWAEGRIAEVIAYCQADVDKTRRLFAQVVATGQILRGDGQPITLRPPMLPEVAE